jgi:hypothetical protein
LRRNRGKIGKVIEKTFLLSFFAILRRRRKGVGPTLIWSLSSISSVFQAEEIHHFFSYSLAPLSLFYISLKTSRPLEPNSINWKLSGG